MTPIARACALTVCPFACFLAALTGCSSGGGSSAGNDPLVGDFIVTISDMDMEATSFVTDNLASGRADAADQLTISELPLSETSTEYAQLPVSNSVVGPPTALAVSPDGRTAFVVASRAPAPAGATRTDQLADGETLTAIDLTMPLAPRVADEIFVGPRPLSVDVHPAGDLVLVARDSDDRRQLMIVGFDGSTFGVPLWGPMLGLDDDGARPSCAMWHPSGRFFGVTLPRRNQVVFYAFSRTGSTGAYSIRPWGEPVTVGKYPYSGRFTPDGRHFLTTDLQWGEDVDGFLVGAPNGEVSAIRFNASSDGTDSGPAGQHAFVGSAVVGISPEGLAISPDGRAVATANLQRSFLTEDDPRLTRGGSVTLLAFDPETGALTVVADEPVEGMPEGITFDGAGTTLAVIQFRSFGQNALEGEIAFFGVRRKAGRPTGLERASYSLGAGRGSHGLVIVPE